MAVHRSVCMLVCVYVVCVRVCACVCVWVFLCVQARACASALCITHIMPNCKIMFLFTCSNGKSVFNTRREWLHGRVTSLLQLSTSI